MYDDYQYRDDHEEPLTGTMREGRVLVAEDDSEMRDLVVQILEADGREVVEVVSGEEMLDALRERSVATWPEDAFGVIVTDHRMPNGNGLDTAERLRRAGCSTPILLITAFANEQLRMRAEELEVMVMAKPFPVRAFRMAVGVLLSLHPSGLGKRAPRPS
jgi:CheY-like chemotaxis protein